MAKTSKHFQRFFIDGLQLICSTAGHCVPPYHAINFSELDARDTIDYQFQSREWLRIVQHAKEVTV